MQGKCIVAKEIALDHQCAKSIKRWECSSECKPISKGEVDAILSLKMAFQLSVEKVRAALATCHYGCPYGHYTKLEGSTPVYRKGHPIICHSGSECSSQLRILRAASTHFPVLRNILHGVHNAIECHKCVLGIDTALSVGDYKALMRLSNIGKIEYLLSNDVDVKYEHCIGSYSVSREPDLEKHLVITHAALITILEKEINDFPEHACCCCERLHQRKSVSVVRFTDDFNSDVWTELKCFILQLLQAKHCICALIVSQ